jgi:hypothetical protein
VWTVTWYVENLSSRSVTVDWMMCHGDRPTGLVDGVGVARSNDLDGHYPNIGALFIVPPWVAHRPDSLHR